VILTATALALGVWSWYRARHARRVEHALTAALKRYESVVNISADAIVITDADQAIVTFNRGAETIFGWDSAEVIGKRLDLLIPQRFHSVHARHIQ
jgi:PAS domain S-box-containing protein